MDRTGVIVAEPSSENVSDSVTLGLCVRGKESDALHVVSDDSVLLDEALSSSDGSAESEAVAPL